MDDTEASLNHELDQVSKAARDFVNRGLVKHVIDGQEQPSLSEQMRPVVDPSTGRQFAQVAKGDAQDVARAVQAAHDAYADGRWQHLAPRVRERKLHDLARLVEDHAGVIADLDALDAGILRKYATFIAQYSANALDYFAGWPTKMSGALPPVGPDYVVQEQLRPVGTIGVIKPWNGPGALFAQVAPALASGNSVVMKPAEHTPMSATYLALLALEAGIPPGVFNVVHGDGVVGAAMVESPGIGRLSFTGSVGTGRAIAAAAARTLKRVNLELGGKSPVLVFPDANLTEAAEMATRAVWNNAGQVCTAGTRTLVHRSIYDDFVAAAVESTRRVKVGHAFDDTVDVGPLITPEQRNKVADYIDIGTAEGATLSHQGSAPVNGGNYQGPVIFSNVRNDMRIATEEIFGPVMSIVPFDDEHEAYALANDSDFGLAAGVFTQDIDRAHRAATALEAGTVWINCYQVTDAAVSYGGFKDSGYGRSLGRPALSEYTRHTSVWTRTK